jgi:DNA-binding XRE family transcriptional regulator
MPDSDPSDDDRQTFKAFQLGAKEAPVAMPGEDANIGDAIQAFNEMHEARRTARLSDNEHFVQGLKEALQNGRDRLEEAVALQALTTLTSRLGDALDDLPDNPDPSTVQESRLLTVEDGDVAVALDIEEKLDEWADDPPATVREFAADFMEGVDWDDAAEWLATHVMYWAARDVNRSFHEAGTDPEDVPEDEWDRRFNEKVKGGDYYADAILILGQEWGEVLSNGLGEALDKQNPSLPQIERLLGLHEGDDAGEQMPVPRPETEEMDPTPFSGGAAEFLSDVFTSKATRALMEADGEPAPTYDGEWGQDGTGHPIRVEQLGNPYDGRATFRVQAFGEPDPAAVEASMGWKMLDRMDMDTVWLNLLLLCYASATHRRGKRPIIRIGRRTVEKVFGYRNGNYTVAERAEKIRRHVEALQSIFVQFQNVTRHGDTLRFKGDMTGGTPLWNLRMVAEGEKDLFSGETVADWHLEAREGLWATEFLHNHGDQFTPLPRDWFKKIDRRGSRNYAQRLAVYLAFQFRINAKNGGLVKRRASTLLEVCGEDMDKPRDTRRRSELKRCLSNALDTLDRDYGIEVHADRVHMDHTSGMRFSTWKNRTVEFAPPASVEGRIFKGDGERAAPSLPDVAGDWQPEQIRHLRTGIMDETQSEFGERMDVSKQYISQLERGTSEPSTRVRKRLDALHSRHG